MHCRSTSGGIQLQHKSISSGFPKWQGDGNVLNTVMNNSVFMYLPDFTWTHPYFTLKAAFLSNHCCFKKKKSRGPWENPLSQGSCCSPTEVSSVLFSWWLWWVLYCGCLGDRDRDRWTQDITPLPLPLPPLQSPGCHLPAPQLPGPSHLPWAQHVGTRRSLGEILLLSTIP